MEHIPPWEGLKQAINFRETRDQKSKNEGNRDTKAVQGTRDTKSRF